MAMQQLLKKLYNKVLGRVFSDMVSMVSMYGHPFASSLP